MGEFAALRIRLDIEFCRPELAWLFGPRAGREEPASSLLRVLVFLRKVSEKRGER